MLQILIPYILLSLVYPARTGDTIGYKHTKFHVNTSSISDTCGKDDELTAYTNVILYFSGLSYVNIEETRQHWINYYMNETVMRLLRFFYSDLLHGRQDEYDYYSRRLFHNETCMSINNRAYNNSKDFMIDLQYKMSGPEFIGLGRRVRYRGESSTNGLDIGYNTSTHDPLLSTKTYLMTIHTGTREHHNDDYDHEDEDDDDYYVELQRTQKCVLEFNSTTMRFDSIRVHSYLVRSTRLPNDDKAILDTLYCDQPLSSTPLLLGVKETLLIYGCSALVLIGLFFLMS